MPAAETSFLAVGALTPAPRETWKSPVVPWGQCSEWRRTGLRKLWEAGALSYKLTPSQRETYEHVTAWAKSVRSRKYAIDISRRWGKSALLCVMALELAIKNPGWRIVYCAPEYKMVKKILKPLMTMMCQDCPPGLHGEEGDYGPHWRQSDGEFHFNNGSWIELIGLDINPDGARGTGVDYVFLDEAAFYTNLEYLLESVLRPQLLGRPHARIIAASTPPESPSHYWSSTLIPKAILEGSHEKRTLLEADQYSPEEIEEAIEDAGGRESVICRREYFAEHVTDDTLAIIPEFREAEADVVAEVVPPTWRDCYVSMDPGWKDHTAVLFAYWHFEEQMLVVEDELSAPRLHSGVVAKSIRAKELALWSRARSRSCGPVTKEHVDFEERPLIRDHEGNAVDDDQSMPPRQPYRRVSDRDEKMVMDLWSDHRLLFALTQRDNLDQQVNAVRLMFGRRSVRIHPRCQMLIKHLKNGVWKNADKKVFARDHSQFGHYDLIAALVYLVRNVNKTRDPAPKEEVRYVAGDVKVPAKPASKWLHSGRSLDFSGQRKFGLDNSWKRRFG